MHSIGIVKRGPGEHAETRIYQEALDFMFQSHCMVSVVLLF